MIAVPPPCDGPSGLGSPQELQRRLSLATPEDTVRGLSFHTLQEVVRQELGHEAWMRCLEASGEKSFKSFFSYPVSDYLRLLYTGAWMLEEKMGGFDAAVRHISMGLAPGFLGSVVGQAYRLLAPEGPRQLMNNIPVAFKAAASFADMEISVRWLAPRHGVLLVQRDFLLPMNHEGGLLGMFRTLGLTGGRVTGRLVGSLDNEVEFSWE